MSIPVSRPVLFALRGLLVLTLLAATGCVGGAWKQALEADTPAGYFRFMRDHGDSQYADEARERLDFHKLQRDPSLAGFEEFRKAYPSSQLTVRLYPALQKPAFEAARAQGTAAAYREFLSGFAERFLCSSSRGQRGFRRVSRLRWRPGAIGFLRGALSRE